MKVFFVGAGPGDPELLTVKAQRLLSGARLCIHAGSLVNPQLLQLLPSDCQRHDSAALDLEQIVALFQQAHERGIDVVRLHSGEPAIYGAIGEQMDALDKLEIDYEVVPGISAFQAAAAALRVELTAPQVAQTIILTRAPGRTPMPPAEDLNRLATSRATLCIFLSTDRLAELAGTLAKHYGEDCPAALVYHVSWPDEKVLRGTLADIAERVRAAKLTRTGIFLVGHALLRPLPHASKLYDKTFAHGHRPSAVGHRPSAIGCRLSAVGHRPSAIALVSLSNEGARLAAVIGQRLSPIGHRPSGIGHRLSASQPTADSRQPTADSRQPDEYLHVDVTELPQGRRFERLVDLSREIFGLYQGLIYVAPVGAVVRAIAPLLQHKTIDPAVVVVDVGGRWAVSLLGGHEGGANELAVAVANILGAEPVISTSTEAGKDLIVGVGCRRGVECSAIVGAVRQALAVAGCDLARVRLLASADIKADEAGLVEAARQLGLPLRLIAAEEIRQTIYAFEHSQFVQDKVDLPAVAEPAALLAGRRTRLLVPRQVFPGVTVAIAQENCMSLA